MGLVVSFTTPQLLAITIGREQCPRILEILSPNEKSENLREKDEGKVGGRQNGERKRDVFNQERERERRLGWRPTRR